MKSSSCGPAGTVTVAFALAVGLAACGSDSPTSTGDTLSAEQTEVMMEALVEAGGLGVGFLGAGFGVPPVEGVSAFTLSIDETEPCPQGGSIRLTGDFTINEQTEAFTWQFTQQHNQCQATSPRDGSLWTFNGAPSLITNFTASFSDTSYAMQGTQTGGIGFSSGGGSGTCQINLSYNFQGTSVGESFSFTGTISGTACGHSISESFTISS